MYFIYLRGIERRRNRQRQKGLPSASSLPQMPAMATTGLGQSQEPGTQPRSAMWVAGPSYLGHQMLPCRRHISRKLELRVGAAAPRTSSPLLLSSACWFPLLWEALPQIRNAPFWSHSARGQRHSEETPCAGHYKALPVPFILGT